jgi:phage-related minor tail protein
LRETARANQQLRDSFLDVGNAASTAFSAIVLRGGNARQVIQGLLGDLASKMFNRVTAGVTEQLFSDIGKAAGFGSSVATGATASASPGLFSWIGGLFGAKASAQGDIIDTPTNYRSGGQLGIMGEAGSEAILPLRRDSSGRLGVGGGGGGVNNVTINVQNSGPGANTGPDQARNIAKEVQRAIEEANSKKLLEEQRVGGMLNPL